MRSGWPVASERISFFSQSDWGSSSSQPRRLVCRASRTRSEGWAGVGVEVIGEKKAGGGTALPGRKRSSAA